MKVPNLFKPEKNLESTTERLLKKEPKPKTEDDFKPAVEKSELEKVLELFDTSYSQTFSNEHLYARIDELIEKSDYKPISSKKLQYKYWTRPSPYNPEERFIFIKNFNVTKDRHYSFAIVKNDKIKEFCTRFEKVQSRASPPNYDFNDFVMCITKGLIIGGVAGIVFRYASIPIEVGHYLTVFTFGLGAIPGSLVGAISYFYTNSRNKKRLKTCYTQLITNDKTAVETAFS